MKSSESGLKFNADDLIHGLYCHIYGESGPNVELVLDALGTIGTTKTQRELGALTFVHKSHTALLKRDAEFFRSVANILDGINEAENHNHKKPLLGILRLGYLRLTLKNLMNQGDDLIQFQDLWKWLNSLQCKPSSSRNQSQVKKMCEENGMPFATTVRRYRNPKDA